MKNLWGCTAIPFLLIGGLCIALVMGSGKSEERKLADATCNTSVMGIGSYKVENDTIRFVRKYKSFSDCLKENLGTGTNIEKVKDYIAGSKFETKGKIKNGNVEKIFYLKNMDYEKGPRELMIVVEKEDATIINIDGYVWDSVNWSSDGVRPNSPFEKCLQKIELCEVNDDG